MYHHRLNAFVFVSIGYDFTLFVELSVRALNSNLLHYLLDASVSIMVYYMLSLIHYNNCFLREIILLCRIKKYIFLDSNSSGRLWIGYFTGIQL